MDICKYCKPPAGRLAEILDGNDRIMVEDGSMYKIDLYLGNDGKDHDATHFWAAHSDQGVHELIIETNASNILFGDENDDENNLAHIDAIGGLDNAEYLAYIIREDVPDVSDWIMHCVNLGRSYKGEEE